MRRYTQRPAVLRPRFCPRQYAQEQATDRKPTTSEMLHNSRYPDFWRWRLRCHPWPPSTMQTQALEMPLLHLPRLDLDRETQTPESNPLLDLQMQSQAPATRRHIRSSPPQYHCPIRTKSADRSCRPPGALFHRPTRTARACTSLAERRPPYKTSARCRTFRPPDLARR